MNAKTPDLIKEIEKPALPVFISNWIFGIGIIEFPMGTPHRALSFFYTSTILIVYCSLAIYAYPFVITMTQEFETNENITNVLFFSTVFLTIGTMILGWFRSEGMHLLLRHIAVANHILEGIGIAKDYVKVFRSQLRFVSGYFMLVLIMVITNSVTLLSAGNLQSGKIIAVFVMNYPTIIMFIADSTFNNIVTFTRDKLKEMNSSLKRLSTATSHYPQHRRIVKEYFKVHDTVSSSRRKLISVDATFTIRTAKNAHLEYIKALRVSDDIFGLHILLSITVAIGIITGTLYHIYILVSYIKLPRYDFCRVLLASSTSLVYYFIKILMFSFSCDAVSKESVITGDIISELYDEPSISKETQDEIRDFHVQLIQNSLKFGAYGFMAINLTLIQEIIGSVTTYLMILVQLGNISLPKCSNSTCT